MTTNRLAVLSGTPRFTRRHMLALAGGAAATTGLLVASGVAHADVRQARAEQMAQAVAAVLSAAAAAAAGPLAAFQQAAQTGFVPVNSSLTFGAPTDMAAGWDGTLWAIDASGAPHVYDPLGDSWQLHGSGVDGVAHIGPQGPTLYFRGPQVFVSGSGASGGLHSIAQLWPQLPPSYQLGVQGAAWAAGKLWLFRGGTYLSVPWPAQAAATDGAVYHGAMQPAPTPSAAPTATRSTASTPTLAPIATGTPTVNGAPTANRTPTASGTPNANGAPTAHVTTAASGASTANASPTPHATPTVNATPTANGASSATGTPTVNGTPTAIGTPTVPPTRGLAASPDYVANRLDTLPGWPQTGAWQDAVLDGVLTVGNAVFLIRSGQYLLLDFTFGGPPPVYGPNPLGDWENVGARLPAEWLTDGFDGYVDVVQDSPRVAYLLRGAQAITVDMPQGTASSQYIAAVEPDWPLSWNPILQQAPSGRSTALWSVTPHGDVMSFDGTQWTMQPVDMVTTVGVGVDGSVFGVDWNGQTQLLQLNGGDWNQVATHSSILTQVSVGNQGLVWTRDSGNAVHQLNQGQLQPVPAVGAATHLAASHDGTLWSCNGSDPHAARFASDLGVAPATVAAPGPVQTVASTGFGVAHCLVASDQGTTVQRYQSPYVFRTAGSYTVASGDSIDQGLGSVYLNVQIGGSGPSNPTTFFVVALDAHTGQELSRSALAPTWLRYTPPVFDALHDTVIVGLASLPGDESLPGQLLGLDARDLSKVRWSIAPNYPNTSNPMPLGPGRPTLQGRQLCVSDNFNTLLMYDTGAVPTATTPSLIWGYTFPAAPPDDHRLPPPVIANGQVYAAWWLYATEYKFLQLWLWTLDPATGKGTQNVVDASPGYRYLPEPNDVVWDAMGRVSPLLVTQQGAQAGQSRQVLYVNGGSSVAGVDVNAKTAQYYDLPGSNAYVSSGFGSANGVVWFGDNGTALHGVDGQLKPVANTPTTLGDASSGTAILTNPVPYTDSQGQSAVLLGVYDQGASQPGLLAFDPTSGNVATIPTQGTTFVGLSRSVSNGVVYAGGAFAGTTNTGGSAAQIFAIRVDAALQGLRDFIIDSQLMQDFDDPSQPTHNPNGVARYQTHLTLVDDQKTPMANETVKLWADQPNTMLLVNGQSFSIGPDDDQFATVKTGTDGTLLIVSGYTQADGSDTPDMSAPPLRAWASFMDPYERMLIYRDREFHNRVAAARATGISQSGSANPDDPTRPNLQTAQKYGDLKNQGKSTTGSSQLFSDTEKQQGQPQNVANAIQQMTSSVGAAPPATSKTLKASFALNATDTSGKYVAYTNTPGAQYSPVNVAANRAAIVLQPAGLSYSSNSTATAPFAYASMTPAEATLAIDALDGQPWHSSQYATRRVQNAAATGTLHLGGVLDDFWNWIKGAVATITHLIVAVAEDIYVGIRFIVNGVAHVFQAIITGIEQIASAIGSFFIALGKLIEEIIEALSILFQFGHIMDTHNLLKSELLNRINGIPNNPNYPGVAAAITNNVIQPLDNFFKQGEQAINNSFNQVANQMSGQTQAVQGPRLGDSSSPSLNGIKGAGSTAHSTFSVQPAGGGTAASTSPQCTWGTQKLQAGLGGGSTGTALGAALRSRAPLGATNNDLNGFFPNFLQRLTSDGDLNSEWAKLQSGASGLSSATSPGDFMRQAIAELIRAVAALLDGALALSNAFLDGFLGLIGDVIPALMDPTNGLLNQPLDIPVLSWLYNLLFGEPLTVINALTLVAAIPVTLIWRIAKDAWPADSLGVSATALLGASPALVEIMGITGGIAAIIYGILAAVSDASSMFSSAIGGSNALKENLAYFYIAAALVGAAVFFPLLTNSGTPSPLSWASWGVALAIPPITLLGLPPFTVLNDLSDAQKELLPKVVSCVICALNLTLLGIAFAAYLPETHPAVADDLSFAATVAATIPGIMNPLTAFGGEEGELVVAGLDLIMGLLAGALLIASAIEGASAAAPGPAIPPRAALAAVS